MAVFGCWSYVDIEVDATGTVVKAVPGVYWNPGMYAEVRLTPKKLQADAETEAKELLGTRPLMGDGNPIYTAGKYRV